MARKQGNTTNVSKHDIPARGRPIKPPRDKAEEIEQIYTLLFPLAHRQGRSVFLHIPVENNDTLRCPLTSYRKGTNDARKWVFNQYQERYGRLPLISTYNQACVKVEATLFVATASIDEQEEQEAQEDEEGKPRNPVDELVELVSSRADWTSQAIDVRATYARVPDTDIALRGLWRVDGRKSKRLTDAYVQVLRVERPHSDNKHARYRSLALRFIDSNGVVKDITVTDEQMLGNDLTNKLSVFASYPETDIEKRYFSEAIQGLARDKKTVVQDQTETLGWQATTEGKLVWSMVNGCESLDGFIPRADAPFLSPDIPVLRHGYYGQAIEDGTITANSDDWWELRLKRFALHPDVQAWQLATIGLTAIVMLPEGIAPDGIGIENGTLRISPELVGEAGSGKSRELNNTLVAFGTRFMWDTPPLLSSGGSGRGDTNIGRNSLMSMLRYHIIPDFDHKAAPGTSDFPKQHETRNSTISNYVDGTTGGTRSSRTGKANARDVPAGCPVRTCNYDHAQVSIDEGNEMIERRACTFVWPKELRGNDEVSRLLDKTRLQGYATWQGYRLWVMEQTGNALETFKAMVSDLADMSHAIVSDADYTWAYETHRNHAELIVLGVLLFQQFLEAKRPGYWLFQWLDNTTSVLLENRAKRSTYIQELIAKREDEKGVESFTLITLRYLLSTMGVYIRSQQDTLLIESDIEGKPYSLKDVGYRSVVRDGVETWEAGRQCIGYLIPKGQYIALDTALLMEVLRREAVKKNVTIDTEHHVLSLLVEKGVIIPARDKAGTFLRNIQNPKIAGKNRRLAVMPVSVLFARDETVDSNEDYEDIEQEPPTNVTPIHKAYAEGYTTPTPIKTPVATVVCGTGSKATVNGYAMPTSSSHYSHAGYDAFSVSDDDVPEE